VDGAGDASFQFTLSKDGTPVAGAFAPLGHNESGTAAVEPGVPYALSEVAPAADSGYAFESLSCEVTGPGTTTPAQIVGATATFTPSDFQTVHCTYTNLKRPTLTVIKDVVNDDGGVLSPGDFTMKVTAANPSDASFPGASGEGTTITLDAGPYSVDEEDSRGYAKTLGDGCSGTIGVGEARTCVITNDDVAGQITIIPETPQTPATPVAPVIPQGAPAKTRPALTRLAITKTGPRRARALQRFSYTIRVRNTGKAVARGVRMRDALPAGLIPVRTSVASTQRGRVITAQLGDLRPGQVRTIRVTVRAAASIKGRKVNVAVARAANAAPVRAQAPTVFAPLVRQVVPSVTG
jgi:uncharacterized repeat protein (TIGR01451 family)